jgi:hypothetical protein
VVRRSRLGRSRRSGDSTFDHFDRCQTRPCRPGLFPCTLPADRGAPLRDAPSRLRLNPSAAPPTSQRRPATWTECRLERGLSLVRCRWADCRVDRAGFLSPITLALSIAASSKCFTLHYGSPRHTPILFRHDELTAGVHEVCRTGLACEVGQAEVERRWSDETALIRPRAGQIDESVRSATSNGGRLYK